MSTLVKLPIPPFYNAAKCCDGNNGLWMVDYSNIAAEAAKIKKQFNVPNGAVDKFRMAVVPIDMQITFGMTGAGLPVGGMFTDCTRTTEWSYKWMYYIHKFFPTFDTHTIMQIFNQICLITQDGSPIPIWSKTVTEQVLKGEIRFNPAVAYSIAQGKLPYLEAFLVHYTKVLGGAQTATGVKYDLTTWPYHAQIGGIEHALMPTHHEMICYHTFLRNVERQPIIKGGNPLAENYGPIETEVTKDHLGRQISPPNATFLNALLESDAVVVWGQAKSHCVKTFIDQLLGAILKKDPALARKVYLMEDGTSPVVVAPGVKGLDYTEEANDAFKHFAAAGMHIVNTKMDLGDWPDLKLA